MCRDGRVFVSYQSVLYGLHPIPKGSKYTHLILDVVQVISPD
jgi:hypothetical protein